MKIQSKYGGIQGFVTVYNRAVRYRYVTTKALERYKILIHWSKYGLESTMDAFGKSRRTLFYWKKLLDEGGGKPEALNPKNKVPKQKRKRIWDFRILEEIRRLRGAEVHPNLGAPKLYPLLHCAFKNKLTPLDVLTRSDYYVSKLPAECKNGWGYSKH